MSRSYLLYTLYGELQDLEDLLKRSDSEDHEDVNFQIVTLKEAITKLEKS